jgi:hypothetical protein
MATITVRGRVLSSWGRHSKAVRVHNEDEWLAWNKREKITTKMFFEPDSDGMKRPSIYLGQRMAERVNDGDLVELSVEGRDTKRGRNLHLVELRVVQTEGGTKTKQIGGAEK